ncbi:MAG: HK97 family phage prohead protease [Dyella sp.]
MSLETRNLSFQVKAVSDDGFFSGYGSVFGNVDSYGDIVAPGAFARSLAEKKAAGRMPALLWQHDSSQPIGVYTSMTEDANGLLVEGQLLKNDVQQAGEAYALLKANALSGLSIGFVTRSSSTDEKTGVRTISDVDLWECSLVTFPANDAARIDAVKSALRHGNLPALPEFEKFLREAGFSKSQAAAIAGKGLSHLLRSESGSQATNELADILAAIQSL